MTYNMFLDVGVYALEDLGLFIVSYDPSALHETYPDLLEYAPFWRLPGLEFGP
jgi:hypothetical protein